MRDYTTDCVLSVLPSKILAEEKALPERYRGLFPIFFLCSKHNSLRFFYVFSYETRIPFLPFLFDRRSLCRVQRQEETKGWKSESKMRPYDTKATRRVDSHRNEFLAPFRTVSSLCNWFLRLLQHDAICDRAEKAEAFRGFHANQFCMIISCGYHA